MARSGLDASQLQRGLNAWKKRYIAAAKRGMGQAVGQLLNDCVMEPPTVPLDTGTLRGSGSAFVNSKLVMTTEDQATGTEAKPTPARSDSFQAPEGVIIARAGFNTTYAAKVHEVPMQFREPDAGNKYLEAKLKAHGAEYLRVAAQIARAETGM